MNFRFFPGWMGKVISDPSGFWKTFNDEEPRLSTIKNSILFPLTVLPALFALAGSLIFTNTHLAAIYSFLYAMQYFAALMISVFVSAAAVTLSARRIHPNLRYSMALVIVIYSLVPFFLCQMVSRLFESFQFVNILGLYGLMIFWSALEEVLNTPRDKKPVLLIAAFVSFILAFAVSDLVLGVLADKIYFSYFA